MISLSKQTVQHIIDLLKEDWDCGELEKDGIPMNDGEKMIVFLEGKLGGK